MSLYNPTSCGGCNAIRSIVNYGLRAVKIAELPTSPKPIQKVLDTKPTNPAWPQRGI